MWVLLVSSSFTIIPVVLHEHIILDWELTLRSMGLLGPRILGTRDLPR